MSNEDATPLDPTIIEPVSHENHEQKNIALSHLLKSRYEGDEQEQRETWEHLKRLLEEDRLSARKLFP